MIRFRPHHFLCALCFQGKGYSPEFVSNFAELMQKLQGTNGNATEISITQHTDDICAPCPNRRNLACTKQQKIESLDNAHAETLGFHPGSLLAWGEAKQQIRQRLTIEKFHQICAGCSWKALGICEETLRNFL